MCSSSRRVTEGVAGCCLLWRGVRCPRGSILTTTTGAASSWWASPSCTHKAEYSRPGWSTSGINLMYESCFHQFCAFIFGRHMFFYFLLLLFCPCLRYKLIKIQNLSYVFFCGLTHKTFYFLSYSIHLSNVKLDQNLKS